MNFRLTAVLFAGVLVLVAALLVAALTEGESAGPDAGLVGPLAAAGLKDADVDTVEITRTTPAEQTLVLAKGPGGKWELRRPATARADGFAAEAVARDLFRAKPVVYPGLPDNLALAGLDSPTVRVTLKAGDKSATVNVGTTTIGKDRGATFVSTGERPNKIVAVRPADLAALFRDDARDKDGAAADRLKWTSDYRARQLFTGGVDPVRDVKAVKLSANGKEFALARDGSDWKFTNPANYGLADAAGAAEATASAFTGVRPLLNALTGLTATSSADYVEDPGDLAKYGLNPGNPDAVRVELVPQAGPPEVVTLGKPVEENGKPVVPARVYAQVAGDTAVVKVQTDRLELLRKTAADPSELRNRDVLSESVRDRADAIDVSVGGATVKLRKVAVGPDRRWVLYGGPGDPREANQLAVQDLLTALTRPRLAKDVPPGPFDAAFTPSERKAELKIWTGGTDAKADGDKLPPEPKPVGSPIDLVFGRQEGDLVYVRRVADSKAADFKLAGSVFALAAKTRLGYLDVKFRPFPVGDATKLAVARGPESFEVTKAGDGWTFTQPAKLNGKTADPAAVSALLTVLATLSPVAVVAESPTADDLKKWGLDPAAPRAKATVAAPGGDVEFRFGAETPDKLFAYATQAGTPWVVTVPKVTVDRLLSDDLRDKTLYKIDPAKATGLRVRGWKGLFGSPQTYEFEKKGADWVAKSPPTPAGFQPDSAKVAALVAALAAPQVDAFVGVGKAEYGLDVAQNADAVEFTVLFPAPTPAVTLVLGGKAGGGPLVYAASSVILGDAATIDPGPFRKLTEKPASLQK